MSEQIQTDVAWRRLKEYVFEVVVANDPDVDKSGFWPRKSRNDADTALANAMITKASSAAERERMREQLHLSVRRNAVAIAMKRGLGDSHLRDDFAMDIDHKTMDQIDGAHKPIRSLWAWMKRLARNLALSATRIERSRRSESLQYRILVDWGASPTSHRNRETGRIEISSPIGVGSPLAGFAEDTVQRVAADSYSGALLRMYSLDHDMDEIAQTLGVSRRTANRDKANLLAALRADIAQRFPVAITAAAARQPHGHQVWVKRNESGLAAPDGQEGKAYESFWRAVFAWLLAEGFVDAIGDAA